VRFFLTVFSPRLYVERSHQNFTIRVRSPQGLWKNNFRAFGSYFFLLFLSLSALFSSFRFLFIFFCLFSSFFAEQKQESRKIPKMKKENALFLYVRERSAYRDPASLFFWVSFLVNSKRNNNQKF